MKLNEQEREKHKIDFIELNGEKEWLFQQEANAVADYWLSKIDTILEERGKIVSSDFEQLKTIHTVELNAIACKSLEDFMIWSNDRKGNLPSLK